jgi:hypothetical protein
MIRHLSPHLKITILKSASFAFQYSLLKDTNTEHFCLPFVTFDVQCGTLKWHLIITVHSICRIIESTGQTLKNIRAFLIYGKYLVLGNMHKFNHNFIT